MCDIDYNLNLTDVILLAKDMQTNYYLSTIYIIKSNNGYNLFSLDKLELEEISNIMSYYDEIDQQHNAIGLIDYKHYCLRMDRDKKHIYTVMHFNNMYELSNAHYWFFSQVMLFNLIPDNCDNSTVYITKAYRSSKNGVYEIEI